MLVRNIALLLLLAKLAFAGCADDTQLSTAGFTGGTTSSNDFNLYANCAAFDTANTGRIKLHERLLLNDTWANSSSTTSYYLDLSPNYTSSISQNLIAYRIGGTVTQTANSSGLIAGLYNDLTSTSATASAAPSAPYFGFFGATLDCNNVACGTAPGIFGYDSTPTIKVRGASGSMTAPLTEIFLAPTITADTSGGTVTVPDRKGIHCQTPVLTGAGTKTLTNNICLDFDDQTTGTNAYGIRSAITSGANKYFLNDTGGAQSALVGKFTKYNNKTTAGFGVPAIVAADRFAAQTAAKTVTTYTVGSSDETLLVSANVLVTTATVHSFTVTVAYTDEGNTSRTLTLTFSNVGGTLLTAIANAGGAVPYEGIPLHIRAKASTTVTIASVGTFTTVTYNIESLLRAAA